MLGVKMGMGGGLPVQHQGLEEDHCHGGGPQLQEVVQLQVLPPALDCGPHALR